MQKENSMNPLVLPLLIILIGGGVGGYFALQAKEEAPAQPPEAGAPTVAQQVTVDDDPVMGSASATVTMIEFSDFQCPFCKRFKDTTLAELISKYVDTGKMKIVYRDFPLSIHQNAQKSAEAAECADDQGKFWEMHDAIFVDQSNLSVDHLKELASSLGIDRSAFDTCLDGGTYAAEVQKDLADGTAAGVTATPTFFINGEQVRGAQPTQVFVDAIERAL